MHQSQRAYLRAAEAKAMKNPVTTYAPITKSLLVMDKSLKEKMGKNLIYAMSLHGLSQYPGAGDEPWDRCHGVDLGLTYSTKDSAKTLR